MRRRTKTYRFIGSESNQGFHLSTPLPFGEAENPDRLNKVLSLGFKVGHALAVSLAKRGLFLLLRRLLRELLESRFGAPVRALLDFREYRRAQRVVSEASEKYGWTPLQLDVISAIRHKKSSDTLYILGSGSSVNQLSDDTWAEIAKHVSVGINHWTLHQFVPDIYAIETVPDRRRGEGQSSSGLEIDHLNHLRVLDRPEVIESDAIILCLAPRSEGENSQVLEMPEKMKARTFVYYRFTPFTRREKNIVRDYGWGLGLVNARPPSLVVPDSGASLIRLLGMALKAGFLKVVLLGVDLSTTYFWETGTQMLCNPQLQSFEQPMTGGLHETLTTINRPFSVVPVIQAYRKLFSAVGAGVEAHGALLSHLEITPRDGQKSVD